MVATAASTKKKGLEQKEVAEERWREAAQTTATAVKIHVMAVESQEQLEENCWKMFIVTASPCKWDRSR